MRNPFVSSSFIHWLGPLSLALAGVVIYSLLIAPKVADFMADWAFLHAARIYAITHQPAPK